MVEANMRKERKLFNIKSIIRNTKENMAVTH